MSLTIVALDLFLKGEDFMAVKIFSVPLTRKIVLKAISFVLFHGSLSSHDVWL
jgi:hypothetical protein